MARHTILDGRVQIEGVCPWLLLVSSRNFFLMVELESEISSFGLAVATACSRLARLAIPTR